MDNCRTAGLDDDQLTDLRNQKLGLVFQQFYLLRELTALENVMVARALQQQRTEEALVRVSNSITVLTN